MDGRYGSLKNYIERLVSMLQTVDLMEIEKVFELFELCRNRNSTIFVMGNGGSAALASHFAVDAGAGALKFGKQTKVVSLNDNIPSVTAIANDFEYRYVFSKQLECMASPGDIVFCISSSGNSQNLIEAIEYANRTALISVALLGFDGGKLKNLAQNAIVLKSKIGDYGPVEDAHSAICHMAAEFLRFGQ